MARTTINELKKRRLAGATAADAPSSTRPTPRRRLAIRVGEQIRDAREAAGLSQENSPRRMGTSQAAIARLEAGGIGATLTTLQRAASALDLDITVELRPRAEQTDTSVMARSWQRRAAIRGCPCTAAIV